MLALARKKNSATTTHFEQISRGQTALPWKNFDAGVSTLCCCEMPTFDEVEQSLKTIGRHVNPGGLLLVMEPNYGESNGQRFTNHAVPYIKNLTHGDKVPVLLFTGAADPLELTDY